MLHQYFQQAMNDPFVPIDALSLTQVMIQSFQVAYSPHPDRFFIHHSKTKSNSIWYEWWLYAAQHKQSIGFSILPICWDIEKKIFTLPSQLHQSNNTKGISFSDHPVTQLIEQAKQTNTIPIVSFYRPFYDKWRASKELLPYSSLEEDTWTFVTAWELHDKLSSLPSSQWYEFHSIADMPFYDLFSPQRTKDDDHSIIEFIAENIIDLLARDFEDCTIGPPVEELNEQTLIHTMLPDYVLNAVLNVPSIIKESADKPSLLLMTVLEDEEE